VGKTNLLHGVARRLGEARPELEVVLVNLDVLMAGTVLEGERENLLAALLKDALTASVVVAAEHVEFVLWRMARGPALLCDALDGGLRLIATALPQSRERFDVYPLTRRFELIELSELSTDDSMRALEGVRQRIAAHHGVGVDPDMVKTAVDRSISLAGCLPAKAIALLDAAASRAALARSPAVAVLDVYLAAAAMPEA
jgi:ATP-dependent Clp protease ATP-binding subunit ClpB